MSYYLLTASLAVQHQRAKAETKQNSIRKYAFHLNPNQRLYGIWIIGQSRKERFPWRVQKETESKRYDSISWVGRLKQSLFSPNLMELFLVKVAITVLIIIIIIMIDIIGCFYHYYYHGHYYYCGSILVKMIPF